MERLLTAGGITIGPLLLASVLALTLMAERLGFWWRLDHDEAKLIRNVLAIYAIDRVAAADRLRARVDLPQARIFLAALNLGDRPEPDVFGLALAVAAAAERPVLRRFDTALQTVAGLGPLLGLLGTVLGLVDSFAGLRLSGAGAGAIAGSGASSSVMAGLGAALLSTALGLVVAIVAALAANYFRGRDRVYQHDIDRHSRHLERLYRERYWRLLP